MSSGTVTLERRGPVAVLTFDRPERHNALNGVMWRALAERVAEVAADLPRALVVTGAGERAFCAGQDVNPDNPQIAPLMRSIQTGDPGPVSAFLAELRAAVDALVGLPVPVIAALNGLAYGGGAEIAARLDLRVMDPGARICFSEVRLGLMPDLGGGPALARLIGPARAADLILTARQVEAPEALALGLVNRISAPGGALAEALALAEAIAANGPRAVRASLAVLRRSGDLPMAEALALEEASAVALITSGECAVGIPAFLARRLPSFPDPSDGTEQPA